MRILMLGWEFPPHIVGGLGIACYGLTRGLSAEGAHVTFVLTGASEPTDIERVTVVCAEKAGFCSAPAAGPQALPPPIHAYETPRTYAARVGRPAAAETSFFSQVDHYAVGVEEVVRHGRFDIIHAHDWMTYPAGLRARAVSGLPLVCHVHSTEYDRCGEHGDPGIVAIERRGLHAADQVIAVSAMTKQVIMKRYGVPSHRIRVVHNAIDRDTLPPVPSDILKPWERLVVFIGRLAAQKGPDYFVEAAAKVLERTNHVRFVLAGRGEMLPQLIHRIAHLRLGRRILFTGFLDREAVGRILRMADLYVMTSVSEPFGLAVLEAMAHGVPVIIPRQAGVAEVVGHVLRVDFWDVDLLADRISAVLEHAPLRRLLGRLGEREVSRLSWREAARRCLRIYRQVIGQEVRV